MILRRKRITGNYNCSNSSDAGDDDGVRAAKITSLSELSSSSFHFVNNNNNGILCSSTDDCSDQTTSPMHTPEATPSPKRILFYPPAAPRRQYTCRRLITSCFLVGYIVLILFAFWQFLTHENALYVWLTCVTQEEQCTAPLVAPSITTTTPNENNKNKHTTITTTSSGRSSTSLSVDDDDCGLWIAPSSIPGAGLGMFAGKDFAEGEELYGQNSGGDLVIPIIDFYYHAAVSARSRRSTATTNATASDSVAFFLWDEYSWNGNPLGMKNEAMTEVSAASPGFGSVANSFLDLCNVDEGTPINDYPLPHFLHRNYNDPGIGAFTTYHNRTSTAKTPIRSGQELFVNYGPNWFQSRTQKLGPVPLMGDLAKADQLLQKFHRIQTSQQQQQQQRMMIRTNNNKNNSNENNSNTDVMFQELWDTFITKSLWNRSSRVFGSLATALGGNDYNQQQLTSLWRKKNQENNNKWTTLEEIRIQQSIRTKQWLEQNGVCADHLFIQDSTLRQAGRGAFSKRFLRKNTIVAPLPLIHITDGSVLNMYQYNDSVDKKKNRKDNSNNNHYANDYYDYYDMKNINSSEAKNSKEENNNDVLEKGKRIMIGQQLLLNYCYGHRESDLLLCPYSPMVNAINHNQTLANVKLRWASGLSSSPSLSNNNNTNNTNESNYNRGVLFLNHQPHYLNTTILPSLETAKTSVLALELVATRDIYPNEEIFLDYGTEWEIAWNTHVSHWRSSSSSTKTPKTTTRKPSRDEFDDYDSYNNNTNSPYHRSSSSGGRHNMVARVAYPKKDHDYKSAAQLNYELRVGRKQQQQQITTTTTTTTKATTATNNHNTGSSNNYNDMNDGDNNNDNDSITAHKILMSQADQRKNIRNHPSPVVLKCDANFIRSPGDKQQYPNKKQTLIRRNANNYRRSWRTCDVLSYTEVKNDPGQFLYGVSYHNEAKSTTNKKQNEYSGVPTTTTNDDYHHHHHHDNHTYYYNHDHKNHFNRNKKVIQDYLPKEAFRFFDLPYTTDMFLKNAFRHPILIPDPIFPESWKNKKHRTTYPA